MSSQLVQSPLISRRPNPRLPRRNNPIRIQRILNRLIESHKNIIIPVISLRNLIHKRQMSPILAPAIRSTIGNQLSDQIMYSSLFFGVFAIED